ncbi:MAG: rapA 2 [Chlorobi bacterium]|nr:rapA 2 [Chlorobiota bacterium]
MILLHVGLANGLLYLWSESSNPTAPHSRHGQGRSDRHAGPDRYPYDGGTKGLRAACAAMRLPESIAERQPEEIIVHLPSIAGTPIASSPIIADPPLSRARPSIRPFAITALELLPDEVIALMESAMEGQPAVAGALAGSTLKFWAEVFRMAVWLTVRGQFLPGILFDGTHYQACWEPVLVGTAQRRAAVLASRMPDACRALALAGEAAPDSAAQSVLYEFLCIAIDALVLQSVAPAVAEEGSLPVPVRRRGMRPPPASPSIDEKWLHALSSPSGEINGNQAELEELASRILTWKRPLLAAQAGPFRLCFRLEEPLGIEPADGPGGADPWTVRYLLQSTADPSLLVDVASIWSPRAARVPTDMGSNARAYLLTALGRASKLLPDIEASLRTPAPDGYHLDATGAYRFLQEHAWLLEQAGFGVLLPAWWTRKGTKRRLVARAAVRSPKLTAKAGLTLDALATVNWEIAMGDTRLSIDELRRLARLKAPLIRMRGEWVELDPAEIEAVIAYWKKGKTSELMPIRDVVRLALGAVPGPGGMELGGVDATGAVEELLERLGGSRVPESIPIPAGFHGTLRPYQEQGFAWLAFLRSLGLGACLADDMGLGKTIQTLALLERDWENGSEGPTLLVCPTSVMGNWRREAERFTPTLPVMMHHGVARNRGAAFTREARRNALVVTSYPLLHRDAEVLGRMSWNGIILDEAQNIKNPETRQARAARALIGDYRIALTGTPVENHVGDLWSIMEFLNPGFLGTRAAFKRAFFLPIQAGHDPAAAERLKRLTGPFILRRLKTDRSIITDLPEKQEMKVFCTLTREQASLYQAVVDEMTGALDEAEGIQRKGMVLAGIVKLKQVCNHPAQFLGDNSAIAGRSGKLDRLTEMLEEALAEGDRALVFTQFAEMGAIIKRHLQETFGVEALFLHGATPTKQRDRMVERFQAEHSAPPIFILSLKAGGSGLNLTAAAHVFHFDRWWNPAVENQATDRAFRIGQQRNVQVHKFLCAGTVEEKIDEMIEQKQKIASTIVGGGGEAWLTTLSTAELKAVLALRADALGE